jgi:SMI1/KNR4 family protein SUKH-1
VAIGASPVQAAQVGVMAFSFDRFVENCERFGEAVRRLGGSSPAIRIGPPATEKDVADIELRLARTIPSSLRNVLINHARSFSFEWTRPHFHTLPHPWKHAQEGRCLWSLELLPALNADVKEWRRSVYSDPADRYAKHWHGVFAVCAAGLSDGTSSSTDFSGGDYFAIKDNVHGSEPVVFLSHDGSFVNGQRLADSFEDFLLRWSSIGCIGGASGWAFEYFITDSQGGFDPAGEIAVKFRELLGVQLPVAWLRSMRKG